MSPLDQTDVPGGWQAIVQRHRLLLIVPQDVGNEHFRDWRVALALKAYQIMNAAYKLNTARVYLVGSSGGGRASSEASICCSDVFTGAICNCGVNFLRVNGASPGEDNFDALPEFARLARERSRFYLFTGSGDGNRDETKAVAAWMKRWGFKNVTYFEQDGAGHADMSDENFEKGLVALDAPLAAEVPLKLKQAESFLKQNRPGQALALCQQAASVAPGTEECQKSQARFDELLKDYQRELAQTQAAVDAGDRVKANAAIAAFIRLYAPWSNDDVAALRKRLLPPHAAG